MDRLCAAIQSIGNDGRKVIQDAICGRCGEKRDCYSDTLRDTFTNLDQLKSPNICGECAPYFSGELLKTAFCITEDGIQHLRQSDFERLVFGRNLQFPCILSFSASRKKHRLFRSRVTNSYTDIRISTDDGEVRFSLPADERLFAYLAKFYNDTGCSKSELLSLLAYRTIEKIGMAGLMEFERRTTPHKGTAKYKLIVDFLNQWEQTPKTESNRSTQLQLTF